MRQAIAEKAADLPRCPHCGMPPLVYHGAHCGVYGDSIECDRDDCSGAGVDHPVWHYTAWDEAVRRWTEHATSPTK